MAPFTAINRGSASSTTQPPRPPTPDPSAPAPKRQKHDEYVGPLDIIYIRPGGQCISQDLCSPARLGAIYAVNSPRNQLTTSNTGPDPALRDAPLSSPTTMPPPTHSRHYNPHSPPEYMRKGGSLWGWANWRSKNEAKRSRAERRYTEAQVEQAGGMANAVINLTACKIGSAAILTDFSQPILRPSKFGRAPAGVMMPPRPMPAHARLHEPLAPHRESGADYGVAFERWAAITKGEAPDAKRVVVDNKNMTRRVEHTMSTVTPGVTAATVSVLSPTFSPSSSSAYSAPTVGPIPPSPARKKISLGEYMSRRRASTPLPEKSQSQAESGIGDVKITRDAALGSEPCAVTEDATPARKADSSRRGENVVATETASMADFDEWHAKREGLERTDIEGPSRKRRKVDSDEDQELSRAALLSAKLEGDEYIVDWNDKPSEWISHTEIVNWMFEASVRAW